MPNPAENPLDYCNQAALNPQDKSLPATRAGLAAIDDEIGRLRHRIMRLTEAREQISKRLED